MTTKTASAPSNLWLSSPNTNTQARLNLFCFPFAGGGTAAYHPWLRLLPAGVALHSIRLPGRESRLREAPYVRIGPLVEDLADALASQLEMPFVFFGHSMGALLAFELLRCLRRRRAAQPLHFLVSGHRAPQLPDPDPPLYHLPDDELIREMDERYNGIPQAILESPELLQLFLPTIRADMTILDTYEYGAEPPFSFPISAFGGDRDASVNREELQAWHTQTQGTFRLRIFAGDHFFVQSAQAQVLQAINDELRPYLQRVSPDQ